MRIAFDGTTLRPGRTGIGYYSEHLLRHLAEEHLDEIIVFSNVPVDTVHPLPPSVRVVVLPSRLPRMVWMQTLAPRAIRRERADVVHFTNGMVPFASPIPTVVTIHDMSLTMFPACHPPRRVLLNRPLVNVAARRADAVITVSQSAKRDIVGLYGLNPDRVHVVHEAAAPAFRRVRDVAELARVRQRYGLPDRFILCVGTVEPRKNLPMLIDAFAARRKDGTLPHRLVCAGPYGWLSGDVEAQIDRLGMREAISFTGYLPFDDLPSLYTLAEMFVFPSIYEGFGLPVIEAMACGTPVVTGRVAALTEVTGGAVEQVERLDAESLGAAMVRLAASSARREALSALGLARAAVFSWRRAARETRDIYWRVVTREATASASLPAVHRSPTP